MALSFDLRYAKIVNSVCIYTHAWPHIMKISYLNIILFIGEHLAT